MKKYILFLSFMAVIISCNQNTGQRNHDYEELDSMKEDFFQSVQINKINPEKAPLLAEKYENFIETYPKDSLCPGLIMELGGLYLNFMGDPERAINTYLSLAKKYPENKMIPESIFVVAEIYHDYLKKFDEAGKYYQMVIDEYPGSRLAGQSKILLDNLGKSPGQLLEDILRKNTVLADTLENQ